MLVLRFSANHHYFGPKIVVLVPRFSANHHYFGLKIVVLVLQFLANHHYFGPKTLVLVTQFRRTTTILMVKFRISSGQFDKKRKSLIKQNRRKDLVTSLFGGSALKGFLFMEMAGIEPASRNSFKRTSTSVVY